MSQRPAVAETREFRDPIYGFIKVYPHEKAVIDTFPFQRLRRISQLALTSRLYHGAEHSRFGHSLGVMHLAGEACGLLLDKRKGLICDVAGWSPGEFEDRRQGLILVARLAGLLYDVGHAPFSHAGEQELFAEKLRHADYSAAIVEGSEIGEEIDAALKDTGVTGRDVVELLRGGVLPAAYGFIRQLLDGAYDVDKMDYLLRDSHYCGVEYGTFDIRRLVSTLTLYGEEPGGSLKLAVEEGGYHALEALVIARYFMFTQVYFHRVRRANDLILTDFIQELLTEEHGVAHYPLPTDIVAYLGWDDSRILAAAVERADNTTENLAWMICNRRHPKMAYETLAHPDRFEARTAFRRLLPEVRKRFPDVRVWRDNATDHPERYKQEDIPIEVRDDPPAWKSFVDTSEVLRGLKEIGQVRLYAYVGDREDLLQEINLFCLQLMA